MAGVGGSTNGTREITLGMGYLKSGMFVFFPVVFNGEWLFFSSTCLSVCSRVAERFGAGWFDKHSALIPPTSVYMVEYIWSSMNIFIHV